MSKELNKALDLLREIRPSIPKDVLELWCKDRDAFLAQRSEFHQHLKECADEVATWPSYKREALTQPRTTKVEQAGGDERDLQGAQGERDGWGPLPIVQVPWNVFDRAVMWVEDRRRYGDDGTIVDDWKALKTIQSAALAQPSPVSEALIYACKNLAQITSSDGSGHADIALAVLRMADVGDDERERLVNEWKAARAWKPAPAQADEKPGDSILCYGCFAKGVGPEHFDEDGKCLVRQQAEPLGAEFAQVLSDNLPELLSTEQELDPLNLAPHAEAFNEAPAEALKPGQAEAERPEVVAWSAERYVAGDHYSKPRLSFEQPYSTDRNVEALMTVAQHERIRAADRARIASLEGGVTGMKDQRDAALARVADLTATRNRYGVDAHHFNKNLQRILRDFESFTPDELARSLIILAKVADEKVVAQHSVPDVLFDGAAVYAALDDRQRMFTSPENVSVVLDAVVRVVRAAAPTPSNSVPQAWLDVQAERRRQITAEGWTPEHDDEHSHGQMARAAACYALAGSSAPNDGTAALLVSLAWPWDEQWWKPSTARRDMVKACALGLAEIERLDRAATPGKEGV